MPSRFLASSLAPVLAVMIAMASIQGGASLAKSLFPVVGGLGAASLRLVFGALILAIAFRVWRMRINRANAPALVLYGAALGGMNAAFYLSIETIPLGLAVALEFTGPLAVAVFASRRLVDFVWIAFALAGLALLLPFGEISNGVDLRGAVFALIAGGFWAAYIVFGQRAGIDHGGAAVAFGACVAAVLVAPIGVATIGPSLFALGLIPVAIAVAVLSTALPYSLEMFALTRMPKRVFGVLLSGEPAIAAAFGWVVLHEQLTGLQWLAIGLIIFASAGVTGSVRPKDKRAKGQTSALSQSTSAQSSKHAGAAEAGDISALH